MNAPWKVLGSGPLVGEFVVNGDKSVSHRSLLIGALCDGPVEVEGWGDSADTRATLEAVRALGVQVDDHGAGRLTVHGVGLTGLKPPVGAIDVQNAGTLMRLLSGILAMQPSGVFTLDGDASIRTRPMERVAVRCAPWVPASRRRLGVHRSWCRVVKSWSGWST